MGSGNITENNPQIVITGVPEAWNKGPVTITVSCSVEGDAMTCEYSTGDGTWQSFTPGELTFYNRNITFRVTDGNNRQTTESVDLKIDRLKPNIELPGGYTVNWTNQDIIYTPVISDDISGIAQKYVRQGVEGEWKEFIGSLTVSEFGTYYFKAIDNAGNCTDEDGCYVTLKVDKIAPKINVDARGGWLRAGEKFLATFTDEGGSGIALQQYSDDGGKTWKDYQNAIGITETGEYCFRAKDNAGNVTTSGSYSVVFDHDLPTITITGVPDGWTADKSVTVSATFADPEGGSGLKTAEYSIDGETWCAYDGPLTFDKTTTVTFRATDVAGNVTTEMREIKIDSSVPTIEVSGLSESWVKGNLTVSATFVNAGDSGIVSQQYSTDGINWNDYIGSLTYDNPKTVYFRCINGAGAVTTTQGYQVKADAYAPTVSISGIPETWSNEAAVLKVLFSDPDGSGISVRQYSYDNNSWTTCSQSLTLGVHRKIYFRAFDAAGNKTEESAEILVDCIAPVIKKIKDIDDTLWQNKPVTLSVNFSDKGDSELASTEYSIDGGVNWVAYAGPITATTYTKIQLRATDNAGNVTTSESELRSDTIAPEISVSGVPAAWTNEVATLHVDFSDAGGSGIKIQKYSINNTTWTDYTKDIEITENCTVYLLCADNAQNTFNSECVIDKIDTVAPQIIWENVPENWSQTPLAVSATVEDNKGGSGLVSKEYSLDGTNYYPFGSYVHFDGAGTLCLRATDTAGNVTEEQQYIKVDCTKPDIDISEKYDSVERSVTLNIAFSDKDSGVADCQYFLQDSGSIALATDFGSVTATKNGTFKFTATDVAGNVMEMSYTVNCLFEKTPVVPEQVTWQGTTAGDTTGYYLLFSKDGFATSAKIAVDGVSQCLSVAENGSYRVFDGSGTQISEGELTGPSSMESQIVRTAEGSPANVLFARINGTWGRKYAAQHLGSVNGGQATNEIVSIAGLGRITDIYQGGGESTSATLYLTDNENGEALVADDIYSDSADNAGRDISRLSGISEVFCGAGCDVVDMTGEHFADNVGGMSIHGGTGNDTIWATGDGNCLFGDEGNDRLVGGCGNDVICGGTGENSLHGGGGNDIFLFGDNGNTDTVEQFDGSGITLWFDQEYDCRKEQRGSDLHIWYGVDCEIMVKNCTEADINLLFGDDVVADCAYSYAELKAMGCFDGYTSQTIYQIAEK